MVSTRELSIIRTSLDIYDNLPPIIRKKIQELPYGIPPARLEVLWSVYSQWGESLALEYWDQCRPEWNQLYRASVERTWAR